ncbi:MAG: hypothetical protein RLP02_36750 [Coleofasciculus sp. C2-GNP5-27]
MHTSTQPTKSAIALGVWKPAQAGLVCVAAVTLREAAPRLQPPCLIKSMNTRVLGNMRQPNRQNPIVH